MTNKDARPVVGILKGTALGLALWIIVLITAAIIAAWT
jgi:hypothetical protein